MTNDSETTTLTDWLLAQIAEDEAVARDASKSPWVALTFYPTRSAVTNETETGGGTIVSTPLKNDSDATHIARHDPARVLRECAAKRAIVEMHTDVDPCDAHDPVSSKTVPCETLLALASVYSDRPGWREEWAV